jgi:peptidoglycan/LPS O-acetylase OafA/YrhL
MVIYSHLSVTHVLPHVMRATPLGPSAVIVFFVLSGFLITGQLHSEVATTGTIRLRDFYIRRIFRLVPALVLMLSVAVVMGWFGLIPIAKADVIRGLTYTADYHHPKYWTLAHLWSLSVEEQFYLLWPMLLLFAGLRRSQRFAIASIFICPLLRLLGWVDNMDEALVFRRFEMVADALALGCLLALERDRVRESRIWKSLTPTSIAIIAAVVIVISSLIHRIWAGAEILGTSFVSMSAFLIIGAVTFFPQSRAARFLSWPPLVWIGKISYSLYIWQQMFLVYTPGVSKTPLPFPASLLCVFAVSIVSYYLYESPLRRFGQRLTRGFPAPASSTASITPLQSVRSQP